LPGSRISTPASFGSQGNPYERLAAALTASLPGSSLFHAHWNPGYLWTAFATVEVSGQFPAAKKLSDGFCQRPGTQKLIECPQPLPLTEARKKL